MLTLVFRIYEGRVQWCVLRPTASNHDGLLKYTLPGGLARSDRSLKAEAYRHLNDETDIVSQHIRQFVPLGDEIVFATDQGMRKSATCFVVDLLEKPAVGLLVSKPAAEAVWLYQNDWQYALDHMGLGKNALTFELFRRASLEPQLSRTVRAALLQFLANHQPVGDLLQAAE